MFSEEKQFCSKIYLSFTDCCTYLNLDFTFELEGFCSLLIDMN